MATPEWIVGSGVRIAPMLGAREKGRNLARRYEVLGTEGGCEHVILLVFRKPFGVYFTVRTPFMFDRSWRVRVGVGMTRGHSFSSSRRERCAACRAVIPNDIDVHLCAA